MLCQVINDLYIGWGNPAPTNGVIHHLSVDRTLIMKCSSILLIPILLLLSSSAYGVFEGSANADIFIKVYKKRGDYGRVALWHEAAAECYTLISMPMNNIALEYYQRIKCHKWVERAEKEREEILERKVFHLSHAKAAWKKSKTETYVLKLEREKIAEFKRNWLPHYPDKFYDFGIYAAYFAEQKEQAELKRDFRRVLNLEADAAEMVAKQYDLIPIRNGLKKYEIIRDAYLQHAALLRTLAKRTHKKLPTELLIGRKIRHQQSIFQVTTDKKPEEILKIARTDPRIHSHLSKHTGVREYAWYQGFAWTVSYYNQGWGNLAIAVIDDKSGKVLDVLEGEYPKENQDQWD